MRSRKQFINILLLCVNGYTEWIAYQEHQILVIFLIKEEKIKQKRTKIKIKIDIELFFYNYVRNENE